MVTKFFKATKDKKGKLLKVHREMLKAFRPIANSDEMVVNHLSGIKFQNTLENCEWASHKRNSQHYHNELYSGMYNRSTKYRDSEIIEVVRMFLNGDSLKDMTSKTGVNRWVIDSVVRFRSNKYVVLDNFKKEDIERELSRRFEARKVKNINDMNMFFSENERIIITYYDLGMTREFFSYGFGVPETYARFAYKKISELYPEKVSKRKDRVNKRTKMGRVIKKIL